MTFIHSTADVSADARIGENVKVWNWVQVREGAEIGQNTILSKGVYIDSDVVVGSNCKIQNNVSVYHGVTVEDGVFVGPHVCFTNDKVPRAVNPDGGQKSADDWIVSPIIIREGASLGAHSVILPGVTVGRFAMVGSGSVVTKDVPDFAMVYGNPAIPRGWVCACGEKVVEQFDVCINCGKKGERK